ncbi:MAG TPA: amidohydrolase family protein [Gemmatimonadota bacterium]|nr:amidohydrolase family protein [Gemmatimonadota bacterium]
MKHALLWLVSLLAAPALGLAQEPPVAVTGVTVVDVTGGAEGPPATVVIRDGRIAAIGPAGEIDVPAGARVVEGAGRWLAPGLWDMHVHLSKARAPALPLLVANGVLGVRDVGGDMEELQRWRSEIRAGDRPGPRIVMAGPYLESPANVLRVLMSVTVEPEERTRIPVADPADARRVVDSIARAGVDFVKVRTWPDLETFRAIADAAAANGLPLAAHTFPLAPDELRAGRVASIEHFYPPPEDWEEGERRAFWADLAARGVVMVPTIVNAHESLFVVDTTFTKVLADSLGALEPRRPYLSAFLLADWAEQVEERSPAAAEGWRAYSPTLLRAFREAHQAGVRLLAGSDLAVIGIYPGSSLHRDVELLADEVGLSPLEALQAATIRPVEFLGLDDSLGTVEVGKIADLVLLEADPLADVSNTRRIVAVIQGGRVLERADLDRLRESVLAMPEIRENDWLPARPAPEIAAAIELEAAIDEAGSAAEIAAALERFRSMEGADRLPGGRAALGDRVEAAVNRAGYRLLGSGRVDEAVAVLALNAEAFPASANVWDSLAEAHMTRGDRERAIQLYRRSLELDPENENARERLVELGAVD